ncbi:triose-phosphate isomerase [Parvimonas micra]|uniref:Triosephosphate isomerase n=1 Tax=Parvimonas micra TaxID=33033 RepID=A0A9X3HF57_9FIRM|nr:triose-phosphate isomerase [Parvimonas micra]MCZ7407623.1 triose-phosphate isomerase [Parvimonas micra]MCZ7410618.1 triose-phosphate isomerase [Parvimonas micra]MCZ7412660.1 triose-phosphate isomerase [Parvimonas micra]WBB28809.1 triose-phosphate isomerase [Parvimonas micra]WBB36286.1 triose-phosphate isomerase [Parvimonas micra]
MRKPVIIGNWKMNKDLEEAKILVKEIISEKLDNNVEKVVCVPFVYVTEVNKLLEGSDVGLGVQNMYFENKGAFTGEISPLMLKSCGVSYVILGHSERRTIFNETDEMINKKVKSALQNKLIPILCCGETLEERNLGVEKEVVEKQIRNTLEGISETDIEKVIIAYEPIWAIGTGLTASSDDAENMIKFIREILYDIYGNLSENIRIQYGGSVKPNNIKDLMQKENVDGALVGGACLESASFRALINYNL